MDCISKACLFYSLSQMASFWSGLAYHGAALTYQVADSCSLAGADYDFGIFRCSFAENEHSFGQCCAICNGIGHYDLVSMSYCYTSRKVPSLSSSCFGLHSSTRSSLVA